MYPDPADVDEPNECPLCGNHVDAHDHLCPYNDEREVPADYDEH